MEHSERFLKIAEGAKKRVREITVPEAKRRIESKKSVFLVDVREDGEWAAGRLPGAIHLGKGVIERDIERRIPDDGAEIILYCGGGYRSALAAESLQKMGYRDVWSMDGGYKAWKAAQYPLDLAPRTA